MGTYTDLLKIPARQPAPSPEVTERTEFRTESRTEQLPVKRATKRYSFEFYVDQLQQVKKMTRESEDRGEKVSQSDVVRLALDQYLNSQKSK